MAGKYPSPIQEFLLSGINVSGSYKLQLLSIENCRSQFIVYQIKYARKMDALEVNCYWNNTVIDNVVAAAWYMDSWP